MSANLFGMFFVKTPQKHHKVRIAVRNNPTQAKRRLEWAPESFVANAESPVSH